VTEPNLYVYEINNVTLYLLCIKWCYYLLKFSRIIQ